MARRVDGGSASIALALAELRAGRPIGLPTETVYGLAADTHSPDALQLIYDYKGRPANNPLIAHVTGDETAQRLVSAWPDVAARLAGAFWPGPLTLILPKAAGIPDLATSHLPTIAVRAPNHPIAQAILAAFGGPLSAPSANRTGHVSPTTAEHVCNDYPERDLLVVDGGACTTGIESTVLDLSGARPRLLRPGSITAEMLRPYVDDLHVERAVEQTISPGTSRRHYAPSIPAITLAGEQIAAHCRAAEAPVVVMAIEVLDVPAPHHRIAMPATRSAYAAALYPALRAAEQRNAVQVVIESPPASWIAVCDRIARACAS